MFAEKGAVQCVEFVEEPHGNDGRIYGGRRICNAQTNGRNRYVAIFHYLEKKTTITAPLGNISVVAPKMPRRHLTYYVKDMSILVISNSYTLCIASKFPCTYPCCVTFFNSYIINSASAQNFDGSMW